MSRFSEEDVKYLKNIISGSQNQKSLWDNHEVHNSLLYSPRKWTSSKGKSIMGSYVKSEDGRVHIKSEKTGKIYKMSLSKLSKTDRQFLTKNVPGSVPDAVSDRPLAGRHSGKEWQGLFAYHNSSLSNDKHYSVWIVEKEELDEFKRFQLRQLIVSLPKKPGKYKLSSTLNVTFLEPPGKNKIATKGTLKVTRDGSTYKAYLIANFDENNNVRGDFTFRPAKGK